MENNGRAYKVWDTEEHGEIIVLCYKNGKKAVKQAGSLFAAHTVTEEAAAEINMNNPRYKDWKFAGYIA